MVVFESEYHKTILQNLYITLSPSYILLAIIGEIVEQEHIKLVKFNSNVKSKEWHTAPAPRMKSHCDERNQIGKSKNTPLALFLVMQHCAIVGYERD